MKGQIRFIFFAAISVFTIFLIYKNIPQGNFNWEDAEFLGDAAMVLTPGKLRYILVPWVKQYVRYLRQFIYVIFYWRFGYKAMPFFIFILFFRLLNVFLIFVLAEKLTNSLLVSSLSSILYGIYQVNFQEMFWIVSGTKDEPMVAFFLLCLLAFVKYLESKKKLFLFLSYFFFFFCFLSEFKSFAVPFVLLVYETIFFIDYKKKNHSGFNWLIKYLPFLAIEIFFFLFVYKYSAGMFKGIKNIFFFKTYFASLPFYFFTINTLAGWRIKTQNWGLNPNHTDEAFLVQFGFLILIFYSLYLLILKIRRRALRLKTTFFLLAGIFFTYLPITLMVASGYGIEWVTTVNWRYFCLTSSLACILTVSLIFWATEELIYLLDSYMSKRGRKSKELRFIKKFPVLEFILCFLLFKSHYFMVKKLTQEFVLASSWSKNFFSTLKRDYPELPKETVFAIEGVEYEGSPTFFENRYLFENIFAMYALPNNPEYAEEQRKLPLRSDTQPIPMLTRVLYYSNIKDFIAGNHQFMYQAGDNIPWAQPNLPWMLPTYDREFLGAVYGFYDPQKFIVIKMHDKYEEYGTYTDLSQTRRAQLQKFVDYYCFKNGRKNCRKETPKLTKNNQIREIYNSFSLKGKEIIDYLVLLPPGLLPNIYTLKI